MIEKIEIPAHELHRELKKLWWKAVRVGIGIGIIMGMGLWHSYLLATGWSAP